jgi:hypothetical protein
MQFLEVAQKEGLLTKFEREESYVALTAVYQDQCHSVAKSDTALQQHQRDSSLHSRINTVKGSNGIKCSCSKTVRDKNGLREHICDSPRHHKLKEFCAAAGTGTKVGHIPEESGGEKLADGLWEKEKLPKSQQYASFQNEETFPFFSLP